MPPLVLNQRKSVLTLDITYQCNLNCLNCDRYCNQARTSERMDVGQVEKFVKETKLNRHAWAEFKVSGGEPSVHPDLLGILDVLRRLNTPTTVYTNGLIDIEYPSWVKVHNNKKVSRYISAHTDITLCPLDSGITPRPCTQCQMNVTCGLCLNRYGYYFSSPCASVDRVFGFDFGVKELSKVLKTKYAVLEERADLLCPFCGHGKSSEKNSLVDEPKGKTWVRALEEYAVKRPVMALY